jgi:hypothetical protein
MSNTNTIYTAKRAAPLTNPVTALVTFLQNDNSAKAAAVYVPDQGTQTSTAGSLRFNIRAWGRITSGTSGNVSLALQYGTATSANTSVVAPTAASYSVSGNWLLETTFLWDVTSKLLNGYYAGWATSAGTAITPVIVTSILTAKDFTTNGLGFTMAAFFGTSNAGNIAFLDGFTLEQI